MKISLPEAQSGTVGIGGRKAPTKCLSRTRTTFTKTCWSAVLALRKAGRPAWPEQAYALPLGGDRHGIGREILAEAHRQGDPAPRLPRGLRPPQSMPLEPIPAHAEADLRMRQREPADDFAQPPVLRARSS